MSRREESATPAGGNGMGSTEEEEGPEEQPEKMNQETTGKMNQETTEKMDEETGTMDLERAEMEDSLWPLGYLDQVDKIDSMDQLKALQIALEELLTITRETKQKKVKELVHGQQKPDSNPRKKQKTDSYNLHISYLRDPRCSTSTAAPQVEQTVPSSSNPLYTRDLLGQIDAQAGRGTHETEDHDMAEVPAPPDPESEGSGA